MAAAGRSIASITITFGLVSIPVDVYSSTIASSRISFNLLHRKDGSRVKQQYVCALDGAIVPRDEMVKGYEVQKDEYVVFEPDEIKALEEAGSEAIDISQFVPLDTVDPVYFDKTYLLAPARHGERPYALLVAALADTKRCAVGRWATRGREHIVIVRPMGEGLAMHQLYFKEEVRTIKDIALGDQPAVLDQELKLARMLIDQRTEKRFDPNEYRDEFRERVEAAIEKKLKSGKHISRIEGPAAPVSKAGNVVDLMEILQRSLQGRGGKAAPATKPAVRKPPKRATSTVSKSGGSRRASRGA